VHKLFLELKEKHVYRAGAAYAVAAWVLLQLFNNVAPILELPAWVGRVVLLVLVLGFPLTLAVAWMRAPAEGAAAQRKIGALDWSLLGALIVVIALVSYQQLSSALGGRASQQQASSLSIAVLPFANVSGDSNQEFFSDGMTDEIMAALAKVPDLRVVARSSAFQFKAQNRDLRAIGQALSARYLIDGSVRKAGNRVRITAQLVQADNGVGIWTNNYDRELTDVFAIQEDIAQSIASALKVPLGLKQGDSLVRDRTENLESYDQYLRAKALVRARSIPDAIKLLEAVVARDPGFASGWGLLAQADQLLLAFSPGLRNGPLNETRAFVQSSLGSAERAAREAIRLDPKNADAYGTLANVLGLQGKWLESHELYRQALASDSTEAEVLQEYSLTRASGGYLKDALSSREKLRALEPFVPIYNIRTAEILEITGQRQAAIPILEAIPANAAGGFYRNVALARAYAAEGRYAEAADTLLLITGDLVSRRSVEDAARLLRGAPTKATAPENLPALEGELNFVYAHVGALDRTLEFAERSIQMGWHEAFGLKIFWLPEYAPVRKTERFKTLVRNARLVEYWRAKGWPDLCKPVGADDFACE